MSAALPGVIPIVVGFGLIRHHDDQPQNCNQSHSQPQFKGFRAGIENIVTQCSVNNQGDECEAHQDGEFFQGVIPCMQGPRLLQRSQYIFLRGPASIKFAGCKVYRVFETDD